MALENMHKCQNEFRYKLFNDLQSNTQYMPPNDFKRLYVYNVFQNP